MEEARAHPSNVKALCVVTGRWLSGFSGRRAFPGNKKAQQEKPGMFYCCFHVAKELKQDRL